MSEFEKYTDDALITLCLEQDAEAWETLVRRYQRLIASITQRYGLDDDDAADVLQSVFFKLFQQLPDLSRESKLSNWVITVTVRLCWKLRRNQSENDETDGQIPHDKADLADHTQLAQDESLLLLERQHLLRRTVAAMPTPCNTLLTELFYREDPLPYAEISRQLSIPIASIGPTRARCLSKLRAELKKNKFF
jgi:RNA polymerase sigma factor (sigma-70 family)